MQKSTMKIYLRNYLAVISITILKKRFWLKLTRGKIILINTLKTFKVLYFQI